MRLLVLGGTVFLGRAVVEAALGRGHDVTTFTRGRTNPQLFAGVERLLGDRDGNLAALEGREWDAVVDTSGYVPRVVGASARLLAPAVAHYTFISSISVYADFSTGPSEDSPLATVEDETTEDIQEHYGALKALSERAVEEAFPGRALLARAGLLVGPHDPTDRFTYWVRRVAAGGDVLAPGTPDQPVQFIDVRDIADWLVQSAEHRRTGTFNVTGPVPPVTMGTLLETCRDVSRSDARLVWVDDEFLLEHGVGQWQELPLWVADPALAGLERADVSRALDAGLAFRPVAETVRDTLEWSASQQARERPTKPGVQLPKAGLDADKEAKLLAEWRVRA